MTHKYKYKYSTLKYKYKYLTFKYKYKYFKSVLEYRSSTSTSTKYYKSGIALTLNVLIEYRISPTNVQCLNHVPE